MEACTTVNGRALDLVKQVKHLEHCAVMYLQLYLDICNIYTIQNTFLLDIGVLHV